MQKALDIREIKTMIEEKGRKQGMITYTNEDCMIGMARYPDNYFDLIITSPPYNLGKIHHTGGKRFPAYSTYSDDMPESEYQKWQIAFLDECHRVLKNSGSMFYNHKNRIISGASITPYEWILKSKFITKQELVWFNGSQNFDPIRFYPMTERVFWLVKDRATVLQNLINHHDLFDWQPEGTDKQHKRSFPLKMVKDILTCFPNKGICLDPFMGSGTTAIACYDMGFDAVGFELDEDYFKQSTKRLNDFMAQPKLEEMAEAFGEQESFL